MGALGLILIIIVALAFICIGFLFGTRNESTFQITTIACFCIIVLLTMMHVSSLPENYTVRIFVAYAISAIAMAGLAFLRKKPFITKLTLTFALLAHIAGIFLV